MFDLAKFLGDTFGWNKPPVKSTPQPASTAQKLNFNTTQPSTTARVQSQLATTAPASPVSGINLQTWNKMTPQVQQNLIKSDASVKSAQANVWNPGAIANDLGNTARATGDWTNTNIVQPVVTDAQKAYHTVMVPVVGIQGMINSNAFGGAYSKQLGNLTEQQVNNELNQSLVPQDVASGKASPAQFGADFTKTGVHYAPYFVGGVGGKTLDTLGNVVADKVAGNVTSKLVGGAAKIGASSAVSVPTFAGLNALDQGLNAISNGGQTGFDPGQATVAGLQAGAMTAAGGIAGAGLKVGAGATTKLVTGIKDAQTSPTAQAGFAKVPGGKAPVDPAPQVTPLSKAVDNYKQEPLGSTNTKSIDNLVKESSTPQGRATTKSHVDTIPKNADGTVTVYRVGDVRDGNMSTTLDPGMAQVLAKERASQGLSSGVTKMDVSPDSIKAVVPGIESEVIINQSTPQVSKTPSLKNGVTKSQIPAPEAPKFAKILAKDTATQGLPIVGSNLGAPKAIPKESIPPRTPEVPGQLSPVSSKLVRTAQPSAQGSSSTPNISTNDYIKQQFKAQEAARKAGDNGLISKLHNDANVKFLDSFSPIEKTMNAAIKNGADIPLSKNITPQIDRALRADSIAGQYIKDNGLAKVIQNVPDTKALDQYLIAKHAVDLEKNGVKTGRNLSADAKLVESLKGTYEPHAQAVMKYNQGLLDKAASYGLISKDTATMLKAKYPNYVPANRIFGDGELTTFKGNGSGKASISTQSVVKKIKGSARQIESPLSSIVNKTNDVISQGERNKAASILADYRKLPNNPFNLRELGPSEIVGTKSTISYLDNGKVRRFETTPEIAAAAKSLNKEQIGIIGKIVRIPTRILRLGATGVNSGFALANVTKDVVSAFINTEHPFRTSALNPSALKQAGSAALYHGGKSYAELVRQGAGGTSFDIARNAPVANIKNIRANKNVGTKALYTVTHPAELIRAVENTIGRSEEFTRALQYFGNKDTALKQGMSKADAVTYGANAARNNTVNFARHGEYGAVLNSALPYLNAGIQGSRTLLRNIKNRPVQTLAKVAVISILPAMTTTAWNLSDPKRKAAYDDISDYEKQGNLIIVPDNPVKDQATGRWNVIKIPVSQEIANLNNIARNSIETAYGNNTLNIASVLGDLIGTTTSINAQNPRQIANQVVPQALKPVIESVQNQNLFTGNQIVPDSQKNLPANEQYGQYTSGTAKVLGNLTNTSPRMIDNTIRTATGGAGQNAVFASDSALAGLGVIKPSEVQGKNIQSSITDRFNSAAAKPVSDTIAQSYDTMRQQLINTPEYKALNQADRAKALNRLQTDVAALGYAKNDAANPGNGYTPKNLTANQIALQNGSKSVASYTTTSANADPASTYQAHLASYNQGIKDGTITGPDALTKQNSLNKEAVTSQYPAEVKDFYNLSNADKNAYFQKDPAKAQQLYDQSKQMDSQLTGTTTATTKYKTQPVEQWRDPVSKVFPASEVTKMLWVIQHESGGNSQAVGDGGAAYGLFQDQHIPSGSSVDTQLQNAFKLYTANKAAGGTGYGDWGEGTTYNGQKFGALGNNPYPGDAAALAYLASAKGSTASGTAGSTTKKSTGTSTVKKASTAKVAKIDYASRIKATNASNLKYDTALRNLLKGKKITRKVAKA